MNWTDRTALKHSTTIASVDFVACTLRQAGYALPSSDERHIPVRPAKVMREQQGILSFSGMSVTQFEDIAKLLEQWLGAPVRNENRIQDELFGANLVYPGGTTLNYLASRDSGVSLYIPTNAGERLVSKVSSALDALSQTKSQSPVAR